MRYYERERRQFVRVRSECPVRYRFLSHDPAFSDPGFLEGAARDISGGGLLLAGDVPDADWIAGLLTERIVVGVEIFLPDEAPLPRDADAAGTPGSAMGRTEGAERGDPVRALTRAAWVEAAVQGVGDSCLMGLRFKEITRDDLDRIFKHVIARRLA